MRRRLRPATGRRCCPPWPGVQDGPVPAGWRPTPARLLSRLTTAITADSGPDVYCQIQHGKNPDMSVGSAASTWHRGPERLIQVSTGTTALLLCSWPIMVIRPVRARGSARRGPGSVVFVPWPGGDLKDRYDSGPGKQAWAASMACLIIEVLAHQQAGTRRRPSFIPVRSPPVPTCAVADPDSETN